MTKAHVLALASVVRSLAYCILNVYIPGGSGSFYTLEFTHQQYLAEMRRDRPWCGPYGEAAHYNDEASEEAQSFWVEVQSMALDAIREYEATHKTPLPKWALQF